ncbi:MAG: ATP-dependent 6-phosphofructokinase [Planctomycetia bacterium]|nr:ATP-dependent 6-phosphofructokinase [Planctomycetia bacterium]
MKIGVFCSGGDAPGMNACIRAIVRSAVSQGHEVVGIMRGYQGILDEAFYSTQDGNVQLMMRSVSGISMLGGTVLHSSRCPDFQTEEGMRRAAEILKKHHFDAIIPIGGNGTLSGAHEFRQFWDGKIVGCPGTIDNDLCGTDYTIGFHTAVQTAVEAVDKLRDTAHSHDRMFIIELMGRHCGYITLYTAIAAGCEIACIPEKTLKTEEMIEKLHELKRAGKDSIIMAVAEGYLEGVLSLQKKLEAAGCPFPIRVVVLGHLLRGGAPVAEDRILATLLGYHAVKAVLQGQTDVMAGITCNSPKLFPLEEVIKDHRQVPDYMVELLKVVSK